MLKFFRKNTKSVIWAVVIAFVSWGGYAVSVQFQQSMRAAGRIFGKEVSYRDYLSAQRTVQIFSPPSKKDAAPPSADLIEAQTWQFLILSDEAKRRKIKVSNQEVMEEITQLLANGKELPFTSEQYSRWVQANFREQPAEFENQVRQQLTIRKLLEEVKKQPGYDKKGKLERWIRKLMHQSKIEVYKAPAP